MTGPLQGLKVLDFTHVLAGPFATRVLGDMGADVIKINSTERAVAANEPKHPYYLMWNRNKRALALDMRRQEARQTCRKLAELADVVIDNFSVGVLDRWGVGYDDVNQINEDVIYVQMSGMGDGGPWSDFVTYAPTIHALSGLTHLTGVEGRENIGIGFSYNDHQAGLHGAIAILAALEARHRDGKGQRIDVSQFEVGANFVGPSLMDLFATGRAARPTGNDLPYDEVAPHGCYPCIPQDKACMACLDRMGGNGTDNDTAGGDEARSDRVDNDSSGDADVIAERWIAIACMTDDQWRCLRKLMDEPAWAQGSQFTTASGRYAHRASLDAHLGRWTQDQDAYELMARCQNAGVPAGVVQNGDDLAQRDPQLQAAEFLFAFDDVHPDLGPTFGDRLPLHFTKTECDTYTRVRALGEDNEAILRDWLGVTTEEFDQAEQQGWLQ